MAGLFWPTDHLDTMYGQLMELIGPYLFLKEPVIHGIFLLPNFYDDYNFLFDDSLIYF